MRKDTNMERVNPLTSRPLARPGDIAVWTFSAAQTFATTWLFSSLKT